MPQVTSLAWFSTHLPFSFRLPCARSLTSQHLSASTYSVVGSTHTKSLFDYLEHCYTSTPLEFCQEGVLARIWEIFDYPCGQRLKPILETEVERLRRFGDIEISSEVALKLKTISPATIDRKLKHERVLVPV